MSVATSVSARTPIGTPPASRPSGLVLVNYGRSVLVEDATRKLFRCVARRNLPPIVSGDRVTWEPTGEQEGVITAIAARRTVLQRADGGRRSRALAANIDQIAVVAAAQPAPNAFLIDRYLVAAELAGAAPLVVVNKTDLLNPRDPAGPTACVRRYAAIGYTTLLTSALENTGIDALAQALADRISILVGQSGVGKSSLIRRLLPEQDILIGELSEASGQGRHTTTTTTLYHLPNGGDLIDSPGVRDFRLGETPVTELAHGFRDFRPYLGQCRFEDCRHLAEPGCAVNEAVVAGAIDERRLASYRNLVNRTDAAPF
jgi:ribosome biogenesis GTPase